MGSLGWPAMAVASSPGEIDHGQIPTSASELRALSGGRNPPEGFFSGNGGVSDLEIKTGPLRPKKFSIPRWREDIGKNLSDPLKPKFAIVLLFHLFGPG